ncbi:hypothetical protein N7533_004885 [Penicillium manginii]|uniref:uncharacterized protein n=1 Tax=Penicillium manginii TaxID=203109 RepID=UPI0025488074|nr:uncharacterized protein N7533_004885 [Penicillium manginii]KAJ5755342.1 hypothetical protein N7533_004885 [Penicillium manginii]
MDVSVSDGEGESRPIEYEASTVTTGIDEFSSSNWQAQRSPPTTESENKPYQDFTQVTLVPTVSHEPVPGPSSLLASESQRGFPTRPDVSGPP